MKRMNNYYDRKLLKTMEIIDSLWFLIRVCWWLAPIAWIVCEIVR